MLENLTNDTIKAKAKKLADYNYEEPRVYQHQYFTISLQKFS